MKKKGLRSGIEKGKKFARRELLLNFKLLTFNSTFLLLTAFILLLVSSCHVYSFKDVSIPPEVKTVKIGSFENKARYVDPQLGPQLRDRVEQKITGQTRLTRTNNDDAHYQITAAIVEDNITTAGISSQQAATNRVTIGVHVTFRNTLTAKTEEYDVSRNFDFSANLTRQQAEAQLRDEILRNLSDEIFNRIFSNW
ncbi:MAG: LPS assembly lipoprotein LptE [Bacteroidota bacterium]|nr:LPS assembly lipoprotein LptE [Bacteroidota bacterium]